MPFLRSRDYPVYIQANQLAQITQNSLPTRIDAELDSIEEASEYIRQKYDVENIFVDTLTYDTTETYYANNLVELTGPAWQAQSYTQDSIIIYTDNKVYYANAATILTDVPGTSGKWTALGYNFQLWYLKYPYSLFDIKGKYAVGDRVFWKGNIYQCLIQSNKLDQFDKIQFDYTIDYPLPNVFPDAPVNGVLQWGVGTPYSMEGVSMITTASDYNPGTSYTVGQLALLGTNIWQCLVDNGPPNPVTPGADIITWQSVIWVKGDNRNKNLVKNLIHIALFNLHSNIAPQNVPMLRQKNYLRALKWLEDIKEGNLVVDLLTMPVLEPPQGGRILVGSKPKQNNTW